MAVLKQRVHRYNGTDYDTIYYETSSDLVHHGNSTVESVLTNKMDDGLTIYANATAGTPYYVTTTHKLTSSANKMLTGVMYGSGGNYNFATLIVFSAYWNKTTFSKAVYYDPLDVISEFSFNIDNNGTVYYTIKFKNRYSTVKLFSHMNTEKENKAVSCDTTAPATFTVTVAGTQLKGNYTANDIAWGENQTVGDHITSVYSRDDNCWAYCQSLDSRITNGLNLNKVIDQNFSGTLYNTHDSLYICNISDIFSTPHLGIWITGTLTSSETNVSLGLAGLTYTNRYTNSNEPDGMITERFNLIDGTNYINIFLGGGAETFSNDQYAVAGSYLARYLKKLNPYVHLYGYIGPTSTTINGNLKIYTLS